MGWKASCVFVAYDKADFLTRPLMHDTAHATRLCEELGYSGFQPGEMTSFDIAIYPRGKELYIGAYDEGCIIANGHLCDALTTEPEKPGKIAGTSAQGQAAGTKLLALYPQARILALVLHSVVDLWGFSYYEAGQLKRATWGAADDGLMRDFGEPFPEESPYRQGEDWKNMIDGEDLCFAVSARLLGARLDMLPFENIPLQQFTPAKKGIWPFSLLSS
jgi:hypothetical protein